MTRILIALLVISGFACAQPKESPENLAVQIDALMEKDLYPEALSVLEGQDAGAETDLLNEKVHLNYGIYLQYHAEIADMRAKMTGALEQYVSVLQLNENNEKAITEVQLILSIYASLGRSPDEAVAEDLQNLGFDL